MAQQLAAHLEDPGQTSQHLADAHDGKLFHLEQGLDAQGLHPRPGDPFELGIGIASQQLAHQTGSQDVAGGLSGDYADADRLRHG